MSAPLRGRSGRGRKRGIDVTGPMLTAAQNWAGRAESNRTTRVDATGGVAGCPGCPEVRSAGAAECSQEADAEPRAVGDSAPAGGPIGDSVLTNAASAGYCAAERAIMATIRARLIGFA